MSTERNESHPSPSATKLISDIWSLAHEIVWRSRPPGSGAFTHFLNEVKHDTQQAECTIKSASAAVGITPALHDRVFKRYAVGDSTVEFTKKEFGELTEVFAELLRWQKNLDEGK
jgi:hypothetical protein